jgi:hypothetical protein
VENPTKRSRFSAKLIKDVIVDVLEFLSVGVEQGLPAKVFRHDDLSGP